MTSPIIGEYLSWKNIIYASKHTHSYAYKSGCSSPTVLISPYPSPVTCYFLQLISFSFGFLMDPLNCLYLMDKKASNQSSGSVQNRERKHTSSFRYGISTSLYSMGMGDKNGFVQAIRSYIGCKCVFFFLLFFVVGVGGWGFLCLERQTTFGHYNIILTRELNKNIRI